MASAETPPPPRGALARYLTPTWFLDSDSAAVAALAERAVGAARSAKEKAVRLYYEVRDGIRYDPYAMARDPEAYRASYVAGAPSAYCIPKAVLLAAAARGVGVPARLGFADVRNHLTSEKLRERMGTDLFAFHGYTELYLEGRWVKATPAFNRSLCERFGVLPLEFDGEADSIFHPFDARGERHMEYVRDRGSFADLPFEEIMRVFQEIYPAILEGVEEPVRDSAFHPSD